MDKIIIKNLEVYGNHGVFKEEKVLGQKFIVSLVLYLNTRNAGSTDDLTKTIHYGEVSQMVYDFMKKNTFQLLETIVEKLAEKLLIEVALLEEIEIEVKKPWAPIGLPLDYVSCTIKRKWNDVYLGVGSNLGDKENNIEKSIELLNNEETIRVVKVSKLMKTTPYGDVVQDDFLNGCLYVKTLLSPQELLLKVNLIEKKLGRVRDRRWGPRTIDLDILLYNDLRMYEENLIIPHCDMNNRLFVLEPLCELNPYLIHPVVKKSIMEIKDLLLRK